LIWGDYLMFELIARVIAHRRIAVNSFMVCVNFTILPDIP
jgi:hypothetical protein